MAWEWRSFCNGGCEMGRYRMVKIPSTSRDRWGIEDVIPGEKPLPLDFQGTQAAVEAEVHRLNLFGPMAANPTSTITVRRPRLARRKQRSTAAITL